MWGNSIREATQENQAQLTFDNNADKDHFILNAIAGDPKTIQEVLELPGEEGKAWE